jgi:hypothetical protein
MGAVSMTCRGIKVKEKFNIVMAFILRRFFNLLCFRRVGDNYFNCPIRVIGKATPLFGPAFTPPLPPLSSLSVVSAK